MVIKKGNTNRYLLSCILLILTFCMEGCSISIGSKDTVQEYAQESAIVVEDITETSIDSDGSDVNETMDTIAGDFDGENVAKEAEEETSEGEETSEADLPNKIVWIGDSLSQGSLGDDNFNKDNPWAPYYALQNHVDIPVDGYGYYGYVSHDCLWKFGQDGGVKDPNTLYIFWVGSNDFREGVKETDTVIYEIDNFLANGNLTRYLVLGTTNREEIRDNGEYVEINNKLAEYYKDRFLDIMPYVEFGPDMLHLTKESYTKVGDAVYEKLHSIGEL